LENSTDGAYTSEKYHFVIDQQNLDKERKMADAVGKDLNTWIAVTCIPGSDKPGEENPPLWNLMRCCGIQIIAGQ
jgi:hypothetical protein